jgi:hypothetical protein
MTAKAIALRGLEKNEEALAFNPINSFIWHNKAIALRNLGRYKEADDCIKMAAIRQAKPLGLLSLK